MSEEALQQQQEEVSVEEEQVQEPTVEDQAREQGWRPQEEWEGPAEDWVDAKQFVFRGELMDRIKTQNKQLHKQEHEISTLKQGFQEFQEHAKKMAAAEYKEQISQLKSVKKQALEENDYDTVVEADEKIADLKEEQKQTGTEQKKDEQQLDPAIEYWLAQPENEWYKTDIAKRGAADAFADTIRAETPDMPIADILVEVGKRVQQAFGTTKRSNNSPITPSTQAGRPAKRAYGKSDLNEEQLKIGQRFVKAGAVKSLKEYAAQLAEIGEIQR